MKGLSQHLNQSHVQQFCSGMPEASFPMGMSLKAFERMHVKPDVICIQETWLKGVLDFVIKGHKFKER